MQIDIKELLAFSQKLDVLFIEDNKEVRLQFKKLLKIFFPHIDEAFDGIHALEMYEKFRIENEKFYDLIITDISMPRLDGIEFSKKIIEKNPKQIILVISAHTEPEKLMELSNIGIFDFIQKPLEYDVFLEALSSIIDKIKNNK